MPSNAGLTEEGIYRKPGILSKATKLMKECVGMYVCTVNNQHNEMYGTSTLQVFSIDTVHMPN